MLGGRVELGDGSAFEKVELGTVPRSRWPNWGRFRVRGGRTENRPRFEMDRADAVYLFTGFISHATYGKYVQYAREMDIPFGYIHSTNIRANMRQIAGDLKIVEE